MAVYTAILQPHDRIMGMCLNLATFKVIWKNQNLVLRFVVSVLDSLFHTYPPNASDNLPVRYVGLYLQKIRSEIKGLIKLEYCVKQIVLTAINNFFSSLGLVYI